MPSHIFTRLGLWSDSITSNDAARHAAHDQGDIGEELHAMDYLTYAYLQLSREADAQRIVSELRSMSGTLSGEFKISYAATAMPVRLAVERGKWSDALAVEPLAGSPAHVAAIAHWAHALAHSHLGQADAAAADIAKIEECEQKVAALGDKYWAAQVGVLAKEARAWSAKASGRNDEAVSLLRAAADAEDALEKLPVTPGPIVPAREQLGGLLLELNRPKEAAEALTQALKDAPGRRAALAAITRAKHGGTG
jgi:tetratricopeptide (TPR) repeat protein